MRRKDREVSLEEAKDILEKAEYGVLSTVCDDGTPYGTPVSYVYDREKDCIYIHGTNKGGLYSNNMAVRPEVCLSAVSYTKLVPEKVTTLYYSAIAFGRVRTA